MGDATFGSEITQRMNPEFKRKWVTALRSGLHMQITSGLLRIDVHSRKTSSSTPHFCAIGVALHVYDPEGWLFEDELSSGSSFRYAYVDDESRIWSSGGGFPAPLVDKLELYTGLAAIRDLKNRDGGEESVSSLNDDGLTFDQIADIIDYFL